MKNLRQAAQLLGISRQAVHAAVREGRLPATLFNRTVYGVKEADLEEYREKYLNQDTDKFGVSQVAGMFGVSEARVRRALIKYELEPVARNGNTGLYSLEQLQFLARVQGWPAPVTA